MAETEVTYAEAAVLLGKSIDWVRKEVREGRLRSNGKTGVGRRVLIEVSGSASGLLSGAGSAGTLVASLVETIRVALTESRNHQQAADDALRRAEQGMARLEGMVSLPAAPPAAGESVA